MRTTATLLAAAVVIGGCAPGGDSGVDYPGSRRSDQIDAYFGVEVADPYRWMENLESKETADWVASQNALAEPFLEGLPLREALRARLTEVWNYSRRSAPWRRGPWYFDFRNDGLQNHNVLYASAGIEGEPRALIDPNTWTEDGTVSLAGNAVSPEGRYIAYARSDGGSDWRDWYVREVATGADLPDRITFTKFTGISWVPDESGFYYSRYPLDARGRGDDQKAVSVYFHALGTDQSKDRLILQMPPDEERNAYASVTEDGNFLVVTLQEGYLANAVHYRRMDEPDSAIRPLLDDWDAIYRYLANDGDTFYFSTNKDAPRRRIVALDISRPGELTEIIPQGENVLASVSAVGGRFIASYLKDVQPLVRVHGNDGSVVEEIELPGVGSVRGFGGRWDDPETFYTFSGFTDPGAVYRYDVSSGESRLHHRTETAIDGSQFVARQVFYASRDGTRIPMFLVRRKDGEATGDQPTLLYGYGGFNLSLLPRYESARLVWLEMGGMVAIPNLRGGGEYGREWHLAGTRERKQNVFDDFIAAAEWLIEQGYTKPGRLVIQGHSNGGLLVGAVMTQRPDLFGAALPGVGVLDMLRYHTASANARAWADDYGLSENEADFRAQYAYSPVHRVVEGACYPPTLVTTGDHDDRVAPWHSYKFAAALQQAQPCANPVLIRIETRAGHGAGTPTWMRIEEVANQFAFAAQAVGLDGGPIRRSGPKKGSDHQRD